MGFVRANKTKVLEFGQVCVRSGLGVANEKPHVFFLTGVTWPAGKENVSYVKVVVAVPLERRCMTFIMLIEPRANGDLFFVSVSAPW